MILASVPGAQDFEVHGPALSEEEERSVLLTARRLLEERDAASAIELLGYI